MSYYRYNKPNTVKQYTSRFLKTVALGYMAFPVVYLLFAALWFDIPANQCLRMLLSPSFYILTVLAVVSGYGLWEMKRWGWYVFLITNILIGYTNAVIVSDYGETHHKVMSFIFSILLIVGLIFRVSKEVRVPYFLPKIRWWESNPRYRLSVPVTIQRGNQETITGEILDLSLGGCFIKVRQELSPDEPIALQFTVFGAQVACSGNVVWRTQSTVTHPKGIGVKFGTLQKVQRRTLRAICARLRKLSSLYRSSRYLTNQDDFAKRFEELQTLKLNVGKQAEKQES